MPGPYYRPGRALRRMLPIAAGTQSPVLGKIVPIFMGGNESMGYKIYERLVVKG